ncbi:GNAT family N-acetyltransferase [Embleya sp. NPDC001921]
MAPTSNLDTDHAEEPRQWRIRPLTDTATDKAEVAEVLQSAVLATPEIVDLYAQPSHERPHWAGWVAVDAMNTIIGAALAQGGGARRFPGTISRHIAMLRAVAVTPEQRGHHIGKALADTVAHHYRTLDCLLHALIADPRTDLSTTYRAWEWHVSELGTPLLLDLGRDRHTPITDVVPHPRTAWVALTDEVYADERGVVCGVPTIDELTRARLQTRAIRARGEQR